MTLERDELALKAALERRRPAGLPPELLARLDAIPEDVPTGRPMAVRIAIAIAPWIAIAAALVAAVALPGVPAEADLPGTGGTPPIAWDPATTGGHASFGPLATPLVPLLLWVGILAVVVGTLWRLGWVRHDGPRTWMRWAAAPRPRGSRPALDMWVLLAVLVGVPLAGGMMTEHWDPLAYAEPGGPGIGYAETRSDSTWMDDTAEYASTTYGPGNDEPCSELCAGPRYIYRVAPGEVFTFVVTVHNTGWLPVTVLGRGARSDGRTWGLALLRDPESTSSDPSNLRPFEPVVLGPDGTVTVAIVETAETCADPSASVGIARGASGWGLIYSVLGWERRGNVWPHFEVDVVGCQ